MDILDLSCCNLCPNNCKVNRFDSFGACKTNAELKVARASLHFYEEPCISGAEGSGTIFFSGCTMDCVYCQNYNVSRGKTGKVITTKRLSEIFKELEDRHANNINLVTSTHFMPQIIETLDIYRPKIPIVYNTSGYEKEELINILDGYVDIYLTDLKYTDASISKKLSKRSEYFEVTDKAIKAMIKTKGKPIFDNRGMLKSGVIIRHLVLPGYIENSVKVLEHIAQNYKDDIILSLMSQFTPITNLDSGDTGLNRTLKPIEYKIILNKALALGFNDAYIQELSSGVQDYIPDFDLTGV